MICIVLYSANKYYHYAPYITYNGFVRCLCFFFLGNLFQQRNYLKSLNLQKDLLIGITTLFLSFILFYWHINEANFIHHITLYYVVNLISIFGFIYLSRSLNNIKSRMVTLISIGTLLIFGTHRMLIGIIDFVLEKALHTPNITYNWYECITLTLIIELILMPIELHKDKFSILFGKASQKAPSTSA